MEPVTGREREENEGGRERRREEKEHIGKENGKGERCCKQQKH